MCAAPASAWACSYSHAGPSSIPSGCSAPRKQRPHRNRCLPLPFLSWQPHAARDSPFQRPSRHVAASASSPPPSWLDPQGAEQHLRELLQPPRSAHAPARGLTATAATSPVVQPGAPGQQEHSALDDSDTHNDFSSDVASSSSSSPWGSWEGDGANAQWLVLDSLGGGQAAAVSMSAEHSGQEQGSEVQPVHHAVLHPPPELLQEEERGQEVWSQEQGSEVQPVYHAVLQPPSELLEVEDQGQEVQSDEDAQGSTGAHSSLRNGADTLGSGVPLLPPQNDQRGPSVEHRGASAAPDPNQSPIETGMGRFVQGEGGTAAAQLEEHPARSKTHELAGAPGVQKEEVPVRGRKKGAQQKGRPVRSRKLREQQLESMEGVLAELGLPPEVADGLLSAVRQGKVAKYITPAQLDRLVRRVLEAGEDLGVSTATLHTVLRRQPNILLKLPLRLLKQRAAALRDLLGCCSEEHEQGEQQEGVVQELEGSVGSSAQGEGSEVALLSSSSSSSNSSNSGSSSTRRRAYPPISLSHVLSVVPCLWCYKIDTTKQKLRALGSLLQLSRPEAQALARRCPTLLSCASTSLAKKAQSLQMLTGLPQSEVSAMIVAVPQLLFLSQNAVAAKFTDLATLLGVDQQEVAAMVASRPLLLTSSTDTLQANWEELCSVASQSVRWQHELHAHLAPSTRAAMLMASKVKTRRLHFLLSIGAHRLTPLNSALSATHEQFCLRFPAYKRWSPSQGAPKPSPPSFSSASASRVASLKERVSVGSRARSASSQLQK